jgi:hypothetical protein
MVNKTLEMISASSANADMERYLALMNLTTGKSKLEKIGCAPDATVKKGEPELQFIDDKPYWIITELPK